MHKNCVGVHKDHLEHSYCNLHFRIKYILTHEEKEKEKKLRYVGHEKGTQIQPNLKPISCLAIGSKDGRLIFSRLRIKSKPYRSICALPQRRKLLSLFLSLTLDTDGAGQPAAWPVPSALPYQRRPPHTAFGKGAGLSTEASGGGAPRLCTSAGRWLP